MPARQEDTPRSIYPTFEETMAPFRDVVSMRELGLALHVPTLIKEGPKTLTPQEFEDLFGLSGFVLEGAYIALRKIVYKSSSESIRVKEGQKIDFYRKVGGHINTAGVVEWNSNIDVDRGSSYQERDPHLRYEVRTIIAGTITNEGPQIEQVVHTAPDYPNSVNREDIDYVPGKIFVAGRQRDGSYKILTAQAASIQNPWSEQVRSQVDPDLLRELIRHLQLRTK